MDREGLVICSSEGQSHTRNTASQTAGVHLGGQADVWNFMAYKCISQIIYLYLSFLLPTLTS